MPDISQSDNLNPPPHVSRKAAARQRGAERRQRMSDREQEAVARAAAPIDPATLAQRAALAAATVADRKALDAADCVRWRARLDDLDGLHRTLARAVGRATS
jgi:hypothetical protein